MSTMPPAAERFLRYVQIDTQSDPNSETTPSTMKQKDLGRLLVEELLSIGISDAYMDENGYVFGTLASTLPAELAGRTPVVALLAHVDTAPDESGTNVKPIVHRNYDGSI
ncbi:MAG: peptidase T, partial [Rhodothermales bacterium]|nr:peptidase T [Rhodothermales bacterium]